MTAADYPVEFGYKAQDGLYYGPNGSVGLFHKGNDRYTPTGTAVVVGGVTIGLTGATGVVSGPHLHTQAGTDVDAQVLVDPGLYEFKPGTVFKTGFASQWGNYVCMKVDGVYIYYCHLSAIFVSAGQLIGGKIMPNDGDVINVYQRINHERPKAADIKAYTSQEAFAPGGIYYGKIDIDLANKDADIAAKAQEIAELKRQLSLAATGVFEQVTEPLFRKKS